MEQELIRPDAMRAEGSVIVPFLGREVHVWPRGDKVGAAAHAFLYLEEPPDCRGGALVCPWHGARYDMGTGMKTAGPGPEGAWLMVLPARAEERAPVYVWGE